VHPNCESLTFLIPDGGSYRGINHYLRKPLREAARELAELVQKMQPQLSRLDPRKHFQRWQGQLLCLQTIGPWLLRTINFRRVLGGNPFISLPRTAWQLWQRRRIKRRTRRPSPVSHLRVAVLPFEEQHSIDAERLKTCKAGFAYVNVDTDQVEVIPHCLWYPYRNAILKKIAERYGVARAKPDTAPAPSRKAA
jgi:hypothetical protein